MAKGPLDYREIGKRIRKYRCEQAMSRENLAEMIDLSQVYIGRIETGSAQMGLSTLVSIANALSVSPDVLLSSEACYGTAVLRDEFAKLFNGCDMQTLRLMFEVCEVIKADTARRRREKID